MKKVKKVKKQKIEFDVNQEYDAFVICSVYWEGVKSCQSDYTMVCELAWKGAGFDKICSIDEYIATFPKGRFE